MTTDTMPTGIDIEAMAKQVRAKVDPAVLSLIASMLTDRAAGIVERMALATGDDGMPEWGEEVRRFAIEAGAAIRVEVG